MADNTAAAVHWVEQGLVPDRVVRLGIRRLLKARLAEMRDDDAQATAALAQAFLDELRGAPLALLPEKANEQHYEVPAAFFGAVLGPHRKYSGCFWPEGVQTLPQAETAALALTCERAGIADGQRILELGCGWGSLTLWMAEHFPQSRITAVSNSLPQREFIDARCKERGLDNVRVVTQDVNRLELASAQFDRVVSIEMFEHMRNYDTLLARIASWMRPGGKLFVHIFCHRELMYPFETEGDDNWLGRYFFTGGLMPAADTLLWFQRDLCIEQQWRLSGTHYEKTANAWLANQDANGDEVLRVLKSAYGDQARLWNQRWRMFWMACAELFGYRGGNEWLVGHYLFAKR